MTVKKGIELREVPQSLEKGSAEEILAKKSKIKKSVLLCKHDLFTMKFEDGVLHFDLEKDIAKFLYGDDITSEIVDSISCFDTILSENTDNAFNIINRRASGFKLTTYSGTEDEQYALFCYICVAHFDSMYKDINQISDITQPIPTQLFIQLINKHRGLELAYIDNDGNLIAGRLQNIRVVQSWFSSYINVRITVTAKSKEGYVNGMISRNSKYVPLAAKLEDIGLIPMTPELKKRLIERGRKYVKYAKHPSYAFYSGFAFRYGGWFGNIRSRVNGRVMIDIGAMRALNPTIPDEFYMGNPFEDDYAEHAVSDVADDALWMCIPIVYSFSFTTKEWVQINIESISDIKFSDTAFNELIVPDQYKHVFISCLTGEVPSLDAIEGKGNGKIFLLYGPPGTGKTMTAESVAEYLHMPLYFVSVGELGITPEDMEKRLAEIMDIAQSWNAIVLLDEVDVFAMKRCGDIEVNAMTAILLRLLERYNGILFMTTNLVGNLDPAFISRATACIKYDVLSNASRTTIWRNLLSKAVNLGLNVDDDLLLELGHFAGRDMNGREIKNCVRLAYSVAMSGEDKRLTRDMLSSIMNMSHSPNEIR